MANTFREVYKKTGTSSYQLVGNVGVGGIKLDIMKGASSSAAGEIGLVPKPTTGQQNHILTGNGIWTPSDDIISKSNSMINLKNDLNKVVNYAGESFTAYQGVTINNAYTWGSRWGYIGTIYIRFTTPSSVSGLQYDNRVIQLPTSLYPANSGYPMMHEIWGTGIGVQYFISGADQSSSSGHIRLIDRVKANTDYFICYTFVIASDNINNFFE